MATFQGVGVGKDEDSSQIGWFCLIDAKTPDPVASTLAARSHHYISESQFFSPLSSHGKKVDLQNFFLFILYENELDVKYLGFMGSKKNLLDNECGILKF